MGYTTSAKKRGLQDRSGVISARTAGCMERKDGGVSRKDGGHVAHAKAGNESVL